MGGALALVSSGQFTAVLEAFDRTLLDVSGRRTPRVVLLPTAAGPSERQAWDRIVTLGRAHFGALGAEVEVLGIVDRPTANDPAHEHAVGEADLIYVATGDGDRLHATLAGTATERALRTAHARGAIVAGCGRGAAVLAEQRVRGLRRFGWPLRWSAGLGLAAGVALIPEYDAVPEALIVPAVLRAPRGMTVVGIDRATAIVGRGGSWQIHGTGRVTVWRGRRRTRHRAGDVIRVEEQASGESS